MAGFVFGTPAGGKAIHPWDSLKKCKKCGATALLLGKDERCFESGSPYTVICSNRNCLNRSITSDKIEKVKESWNKLNA